MNKNLIEWIFIILCLIFWYSYVHCQEITDEVDIYHKGKYQFSLTYDEFNAILKSANNELKIIEAENAKRVIVELEDKDWALQNDIIDTNITVKWIGDNQEILKSITLNLLIKTTESQTQILQANKLLKYYTETAKYGFPILLILVIIFIII
jgi:hypothetical protein